MIDKKYYQMALDIQTACNLSGVVFSFADVMQAICEEDHKVNGGTEWKNHHPIAVLFAAQISHLTTGSLTDTHKYYEAYAECKRMVEE